LRRPSFLYNTLVLRSTAVCKKPVNRLLHSFLQTAVFTTGIGRRVARFWSSLLSWQNVLTKQKAKKKPNLQHTTNQTKIAEAIRLPNMTCKYDNNSVATSASDIEITKDGIISIHESTTTTGSNPHTKRQLVGATFAGALAGCLGCGPCLGIPLGAGTAALAVSSKSRAGALTRKGGDGIATLGDKLRHFDNEHYLTEKIKTGASKTIQWTRGKLEKVDEEYHLFDKTKVIANDGFRWAQKRLEPRKTPSVVEL